MSDKAKGILIYVFGWIGGLIFLLQKDSTRNIKMHAAQSIVGSVAAMILILLPIPFTTTIGNILSILVLIFGIVKVCQEDAPEIPVLSDIAKAIFGKVIDG